MVLGLDPSYDWAYASSPQQPHLQLSVQLQVLQQQVWQHLQQASSVRVGATLAKAVRAKRVPSAMVSAIREMFTCFSCEL